MDDLISIEIVEGELRVDSRLIAVNLGVEHKHTIEMIRKYEPRFFKYGEVLFKTAPSLNTGSCQNVTVCYLNEQQSTFLVTLSRNSENAVNLKQKLTESYHYYKSKTVEQEKQLLTLPENFAESLRLLADQVEKNQLLETKITKDKPLVEFAENISRSEGTLTVGEFAKILCKRDFDIGPNRLFKLMRDKDCLNLLITTQKPFQHALDNKWLEVEEFPFEDTKGVERISKKVLITGKGQKYIERKLRKFFKNHSGI